MKKLSWLWVLSLLSLTACGSPSQPTDAAPQQNPAYTEADYGSSVVVKPGEELVITLESNPTSGYSWQVVEIDGAILSQKGESEFEQTANSDGVVGAGGTETFRFVAVSSGETILTLGYFRPWEDQPLVKTFTLTVIVE